MGAFKQVASAYTNFDLQASQQEFSRRRKVLVIPDEYIRFELDIIVFPELTLDKVERILSELWIRGVLKPTDIVKAVAWDFNPETLKVFVINPDLPIVPEATHAPEEFISLDPA